VPGGTFINHREEPVARLVEFSPADEAPKRSPVRGKKDGGPSALPVYLRKDKESIDEILAEWLRGMHIDTSPPVSAIRLRRDFTDRPSELKDIYLQFCRFNASVVKHRFKPRLCSTCVGYSAETAQSCSLSNSRRQLTKAPKELDDLEHARSDLITARIYEWKLHRFIEQGGLYLYSVWKGGKTNVAFLLAEYWGNFIIANEAVIDDYVEDFNKYKNRRLFAKRFTKRDHSEPAADDPTTIGETDAGEYPSVPEVDDEDAPDPSDNFPYPMIAVSLNEQNILELKMHLSDAQVRSMLVARGESDALSRSCYLFTTKALCIGEDKWFGFSGGFAGKVVHFLRAPDKTLDSLFIDGLCFEKRRPIEVFEKDPFTCTRCGTERAHRNAVRVNRHSRSLTRGLYYCAVCRTETLHVSQVAEFRRPRPPWDASVGKLVNDPQKLSEEPFAGFRKKIKSRGGLGAHKF
jgi:hypothetical protein